MSLLGHGADRLQWLRAGSSAMLVGGEPYAWLQKTSNAARVLSAMFLITSSVVTQSPAVLLSICLLALCGAFAAHLDVAAFTRTTALLVIFFVGPVAALSTLTLFVPGNPAAPFERTLLSRPGMAAGAMLMLRSFASLTVMMLLVRSAGFYGIMRGLRRLHIPAGMITVAELMFAHVQVLARTAWGMLLGSRARRLSVPGLRETYTTGGVQVSVLLQKSLAMGCATHGAMLARGLSSRPVMIEDRVREAGKEDIAVVGLSLSIATASLFW